MLSVALPSKIHLLLSILAAILPDLFLKNLLKTAMLNLNVITLTMLVKMKQYARTQRLNLKTVLMVKILSLVAKLNHKVATIEDKIASQTHLIMVEIVLTDAQITQKESGLKTEKSMKLWRRLTGKVLSIRSTDGLTSMD